MRAFLSQICAAGIFAISYSVIAADATKTLRVAFIIAETSFDNAFASDEASQSVTERIFEPLLEYDYVSRKVKLVPRTAAALPQVSEDGKTFTFTLQKGIIFADDPAFNGKPRELIAADYAYALKRLMDPKVKSPWAFLVDGKVLGSVEERAAAQRSGKFDYDAPMAGLEIIDRYSLRIRLAAPDFNFLYILAMPSTGASAREVIEKYGTEIGAHPVGTGPYKLGGYKRSSKTTLIANPSYRKRTWDWASTDSEDQALIAKMKGKPVPSIAKIEIAVIEEGQALWLSFLNGQQDYIADLPPAAVNLAKTGSVIKPEFAAKGMVLAPRPKAGLWYDLFNLNHPVVGGYSKERIALRRAIQYAWPMDEFINVIWNKDGEVMNGLVPKNLTGWNPARRPAHVYDLAISKKLLDRFGYRDRDGDGWREQPDGAPLLLERDTGTSALARQEDELWKKAMDSIGIRITFKAQKAPDRRLAAREGKITMVREGWNADYPDAENFLQLLYGKNAGAENYAQFKLKDFDQRYEKIRTMPDGPARNAIIDEMQDLVVAYAPWINFRADISYTLQQPWLQGFRKHAIMHEAWEYMDIDAAAQRKK